MVKFLIVLFVLYILVGAIVMFVGYVGYMYSGDTKNRDALDELCKMGGEATGIGTDRYFKRTMFKMGILWPKVLFFSDPENAESKLEEARKLYKELKEAEKHDD